MSPVRIGIIIGSTRPGRVGDQVAKWVLAQATARTDAEFELVDLADFALPHLDEAVPPSMGQYAQAHTKAWAEKVDSFDGFIFVTPEYNHSTSGALKNALDFVYGEWNNKAAGLVSYGAAGGTRAAEHLRLILGELQVADVRQQVAFSLMTDFENYSTFTPAAYHAGMLATQLDQLVPWAVRAPQRARRGPRPGRVARAVAARAHEPGYANRGIPTPGARTPPSPPAAAIGGVRRVQGRRRQAGSYVRQSASSAPGPMRTDAALHSSDSLCTHSARWQAPTWVTTLSSPPLVPSGMKVAHSASPTDPPIVTAAAWQCEWSL